MRVLVCVRRGPFRRRAQQSFTYEQGTVQGINALTGMMGLGVLDTSQPLEDGRRKYQRHPNTRGCGCIHTRRLHSSHICSTTSVVCTRVPKRETVVACEGCKWATGLPRKTSQDDEPLLHSFFRGPYIHSQSRSRSSLVRGEGEPRRRQAGPGAAVNVAKLLHQTGQLLPGGGLCPVQINNQPQGFRVISRRVQSLLLFCARSKRNETQRLGAGQRISTDFQRYRAFIHTE